MDFDYSPKTKELQAQLLRFMDEHIYPTEQRYEDEIEANTKAGKRWTPLPIDRGAQAQGARRRACGTCSCRPTARRPRATRARGLSNHEYAPLSEIMGRVPWSPRGVQLLGARHRQHGDDRALRLATSIKAQWLEPLLDGKIRSRLRDDRAGRRLVGRDQHRRPASSARATTTSSTAASGGPAAPATRAARSTSSWARPTPTRRAIRSSR